MFIGLFAGPLRGEGLVVTVTNQRLQGFTSAYVPNLDIIAIGESHMHPVRTDGNSPSDILVRANRLEYLPGGRIENAHNTIFAHCGQGQTVGRQIDVIQARISAVKILSDFPGRHIPFAHFTILSGRIENGAIGTKGNASGSPLVSRENAHFPILPRIPHPHRTILGSGCNQRSGGADI